jgi:hypothetical protein
MSSNMKSNARIARLAAAARATRPSATPALAALAAALLAVTGCGSGATKTASISAEGGAANAGSTTASSSATTGMGSHASSTGTTTAQSRGGSTRTAPSPAFTEHGGSGTSGSQDESLTQAVAAVKAHGFTPEDTSQYRPNQTLRVLVATRTGSNDGYDQQAFFFVDGRYLGTDASAPSAGITVVAQSDTEVTLGYRLYRPGDPLCCARGGQADVRFQLNDGRLVALDPIPPVSSSSGPSRQ